MVMSEVQFNGEVTLKDDPEFSGLLYGESMPPDPTAGPVMLVYIKCPGATHMRGIKLFLLSDLVKVERRMR